jgi:putative membrane protein
MEEVIIKQATFSKKVITYILLLVAFYLLMGIVTIPLLLVWFLGFGQWLSKKYFHTLSCTLTNKNLQFSKGLIVHIEKTIPLENIQDLSFIGGPILRAFSLTLIKVETAGGGGTHGQNSMMSIIGIENAEDFKKEILLARERIKEGRLEHNTTVNTNNDFGLEKINNSLLEIKALLAENLKNLK